ncbi:nadh oxidase [Stagonosporopsis vannaccii]|nr:nadh oxidase [Stagonosporopsis vannaccii]
MSRLPSAQVDPAPLTRPLHFAFANRSAPNRFMKAAMTERLASWHPTDLNARGVPSKELINLYKRWGEGGLGLILTGNLMVDPDHLEGAGNLVVPRGASLSGERFERYKELARQTKEHDVQLKGTVMGMTFAKPRAATEVDIAHVVEGFAHAAEYLEEAGFDGVQLHAAHGYLLAQFLSPTTNHRTDKYGGSLENRSRLIIEIAQAVRRRTSSKFVLGIKLNSVEFQDKGFDTEEARTLCQTLEQNHFDFVELSGGTYENLAFEHKRESTKQREAFFLEFAELITPALKDTKTYVTGGLRTVGAMVNALGTVDGIGIARPVCQEPYFAKDIAGKKILGAIAQKLDQSNFGLTNVAAGTQMRQIGRDQAPIDLSLEENVEAFKKDMETWQKKQDADTDGVQYGYVDIVSVAGTPFAVN